MAILSVPMWEKLSSNEAKSDMKSNMIMGFNQKYSSICSSTILVIAKHNPDILMFSSVGQGKEYNSTKLDLVLLCHASVSYYFGF